jgi:hypothetical protein
MLTLAEVADMRGGSVQDVRTLASRGSLVIVQEQGHPELVPSFLLDSTGQGIPGIEPAILALRPVVATPLTVAAWLLTPQTLLGDRSPVAWLRDGSDPSVVESAAKRVAAILAR